MAFIVPLINRDRRMAARIMRENLRDFTDPFRIHEDLFIAQYRLPQIIAMRLIDEIRLFAHDIGDVPIEIQILTVLNFYASGSYQLRVGSSCLTAVSQTTVSRYIEKYTNLIVEHLAPRYIRFPKTQANITTTKQNFMFNFNIPGVLGIIDGTHIPLTALSRAIENAYINRKGSHSINAQIVCNADMMITAINARYPGSIHDSFVFGSSELNIYVERLYNTNPNEMNFLLGYPLLPWLMKRSDNNGNLNNDQQNFNRTISRARQIVERCIGILKMRFRCILNENKLRYNPTKAGNMVNACAVLHNFLIANRFHMMRDIDEDMLRRVIAVERNYEIDANVRRRANQNFILGEQRRNILMNQLQN